MALIYHDIYRRKCRTFVRFQFACTDFDDHLKSQSLRTPKSGCVCTEYRATLKISESFKQKEDLISWARLFEINDVVS